MNETAQHYEQLVKNQQAYVDSLPPGPRRDKEQARLDKLTAEASANIDNLLSELKQAVEAAPIWP